MTFFTALKTLSAMVGLFALATPNLALAQVVVSDLPDIMASDTSTLPEGPYVGGGDDCRGNYSAASTPAGQYVEDHGWGVISEVALGDYQLVSFAGEFLNGTSGSCSIEQSNIGVFEGTTLKAILYTANKTDQLIGTLDLRPSGAVRLWSGDFVSLPVADITPTEAGLTVGAVAAKETFCGASIVPNVYNAPITEARKTLKIAGWKPVPQPREGSGQQGDLHDLGITETETCSGTGFGYCSYTYRSAGAVLDLITVGEIYENDFPTVVDFSVSCAN